MESSSRRAGRAHDGPGLPGFGVDFAQVRTYSWRVNFRSVLGYGWDITYNRRLTPSGSSTCEGELLYGAEATALRFRVASDNGTSVLYESADGVHLTLRGQHRAAGVITWTVEQSADGTV